MSNFDSKKFIERIKKIEFFIIFIFLKNIEFFIIFIFKIKMSDFEKVCQFVKESTKHFDASHDFNHAIDVYNMSMRIIQNETNIDVKLIMICALCHDVCDAKYADRGSISRNELIEFIKSIYPEEADNILLIIDNISYSKEIALRQSLSNLNCDNNLEVKQQLDKVNQYYRDIVSDADKILAIGKKGLERCYQYGEAYFIDKNKDLINDKIELHNKVQKHVLQHCHDKLKRLYPENFIRTPEGRKIAQPLHQEIIDYIQQN